MSTCSECGRPRTNWSDQGSAIREGALKVEQLGQVDRLFDYRSWRMRWGLPYVNDVPDQIEYRYSGEPVAALELTRCDLAEGYRSIPRGYLNAVWNRFTRRDKTQSRSLSAVSSALGIPGYMVVYTSTLKEFHMRNVSVGDWISVDADGYRAILTGLRGDMTPRRRSQ